MHAERDNIPYCLLVEGPPSIPGILHSEGIIHDYISISNAVNKTVQLCSSADIEEWRARTTLTIFNLPLPISSNIQGLCVYQVPAIREFLRVNDPVDLPSIDSNLEIAQRLVNTHRCPILWMALVHYLKELFCMAAIGCDEQEIINEPE